MIGRLSRLWSRGSPSGPEAQVPARRGAFRLVAAVRQYPVLPITVLLLVLVIPGIFANQIATYNPTQGVLGERLLAPAWVGPTVTVRKVVVEIDRQDFQSEILLDDAQRLVRIGDATVVGGPEGKEVALGDELRTVTRRGGSWDHPLGTDNVGRDVLSRIIHGARISLVIALVSIFLGGMVGVTLGLLAGYFGGFVDHLIMRVVDIFMAFPAILLALVLAVILTPGFTTVVFIIALVIWARYSRMVRGETLRVRELDFIARAKVAGASSPRIIVRHVFPNIVNSVIVLATLEVGQVIIFEAALSFLGVGIPPPHPAWGLMVADGRAFVITHWWLSFFPGLAILLTVLSMNLFGDWLRDKLDPRLRNV